MTDTQNWRLCEVLWKSRKCHVILTGLDVANGTDTGEADLVVDNAL